MFVSLSFLVGISVVTSVKVPDGPQGPSGAILKVLQKQKLINILTNDFVTKV